MGATEEVAVGRKATLTDLAGAWGRMDSTGQVEVRVAC